MARGGRFCLEQEAEKDCPLCLGTAYTRCNLCVQLEDPCPADCVVLHPCEGCSCLTRMPVCCGAAIFAGLLPGHYRLGLIRRGIRAELAVVLSPGGNVVVYWNFCRRQWRWVQDRVHCAFNRV